MISNTLLVEDFLAHFYMGDYSQLFFVLWKYFSNWFIFRLTFNHCFNADNLNNFNFNFISEIFFFFGILEWFLFQSYQFLVYLILLNTIHDANFNTSKLIRNFKAILISIIIIVCHYWAISVSQFLFKFQPFQVYSIFLNTLFATLLPVILLFYLNMSTVKGEFSKKIRVLSTKGIWHNNNFLF